MQSLRRPRLAAFATAILLAATAPAFAVMPIVSEERAREAAVKILVGAPYGGTPQDVSRILSKGRFMQADEKPFCAENRAAVWAFSVSTVHEGRRLEGTILIKAANGAFDCANLPFQD